MSYDVSLAAYPGAGEPYRLALLDVNYTSNCAAMFDSTPGGLRTLDRMNAVIAGHILTDQIEAMKADPEKYAAMDPSNGWGDSLGWLRFLTEIRDACLEAPNAVLVVSA